MTRTTQWWIRLFLRATWPAALAAAWWTARLPGDDRHAAVASTQAAPPAPDHSAWLRDSLLARNPFRISRRPSRTPFGGSPPGDNAQAPPPLRLAVSGIVWGPVPSAIITGLPTPDESRLMRVGDVFAGFRVVRIRAGSVVLAGGDSTLRLSLPGWRGGTP